MAWFRWSASLSLCLLSALLCRRLLFPSPPSPHDLIGPSLPLPSLEVREAAARGWTHLRPLLQRAGERHVIVQAKNGLGNRMRALASAMAVSARLGRPLILLWAADLHCNCSYGALFAQPYPFALCESEVDYASVPTHTVQLYNYM